MTSRRQTLGALSPSQLNSRGNAVPGRVSKDPKQGKPVRGERFSSTGTDRRSSVYGKSSSTRQDPRPIGTKEYTNACIKTVVAYLTSHSYPFPISPKTLTTPTAKEFTTLIQYLFQKLDPTLKTLGKVEDEVPALLKRVGYPFQISKSALFAVGSPHSWPAVLAAVTWLVELLNYLDKVEVSFPASFDDRQRGEREFYEYISGAYKHFLAGDDQRCQEAESEQQQQCREREQVVAEETGKVRAELQQTVREIERLRAEPSPLLAAKEQKAEAASEVEKQMRALENLQAYKATLQKKIQDKQADVAAREKELASFLQANEELRQQLSAQTINKSEVNKWLNERVKEQKVLESLRAQREELDAQVLKLELQVEHALQALQEAARRYNTLADRLRIIPATAKRAAGIAFELEVRRVASTPSGASSAAQQQQQQQHAADNSAALPPAVNTGGGEVLNIDLKGSVRPALQRLCETYVTRRSDLQRDALALAEQLDSAKEAAAEKVEEAAGWAEQAAKLEARYRELKDVLDSDVRDVAARVEQAEAESAAAAAAAAKRQAESHARRLSAEAECEELRRRVEGECRALQSELTAALELLVGHKLALGGGLASACAEMEQLVAHAESLTPPTNPLAAADC